VDGVNGCVKSPMRRASRSSMGGSSWKKRIGPRSSSIEPGPWRRESSFGLPMSPHKGGTI
jgi:hypothetical protein